MQNVLNSSCTPQDKAECVTWYNETGSVTTVRRKFSTRHQRTASCRNTIFNWVRNFDLRANVEDRNTCGRLSINPQAIRTVSGYFRAHRRRSLWRAQKDLQIPHTTIHKILKITIQMFPYNIRRVQNLSHLTFFSGRIFQRGPCNIFDRTPISYDGSSSLTNTSFTCPELWVTKMQGFAGPQISTNTGKTVI